MKNYEALLTPNVVKSFPQETDYIYQPLPDPYLSSLDLKPDVFEVDNQLSVGSCTANAATSVCEDILKKEGEGVSLSRLFNYWISRNIILEQPGVNGSTMRAAVRAIKHFGVCRELLWPYNIPFADTRPSDEAFAEAITRCIQRYEVISTALPDPLPSPEGLTQDEWWELIYTIVGNRIVHDIKSSLNEGIPVVFSCALGQQWYSLTGPWQGHIYTVPRENDSVNPIVGGHAMMVIGYDDACQRMLIENSWGSEWGDGGFGGMPYDAFGHSFYEGFVVRGFDGLYRNDPLQAQFDWIQKMYLGFYGRHADLDGMLYWRDRLISEGFGNIVEAFMTSSEASSLYTDILMKEANRLTREGI